MKGHTRNIAGYICQSFLTEHNKLIEKYNNTWSTFTISIRKKLDSEPAVSGKYLTTKLNLIKVKQKHFPIMVKCKKNILIVFACRLISIDSILEKYGNYYPQIF